MKKKRIIIIILITILLVLALSLTLLYFFRGNKYTINDITNYLKKYNIEFNIKDIRNQKIYIEDTDLALFECSPKNNSSIKFYIYETCPPMLLPFEKKHLTDSYKEEVNNYLENTYIKKIIIEKDSFNDSINSAIKEIDSIREQIYNEKNKNFGIPLTPNDSSSYVCLTIDYRNKMIYSSNEKDICFDYNENTKDVLINELNKMS